MTTSTIVRVLCASILLLEAWVPVAVAQDPRAPTERRAEGRPGELGLREALQRAVAQHPLVEAARFRVSAARGVRLTARTLPNPVLTYWDLRGAGRAATPALDRETQAYATLPLEPLFQRWPRVRGAEEFVRAADADLARARQLVALDAARAFYRVATAQVAVDAAEEIRARLAELVTFNAARVSEGVTAEADLIRTQVELDRVAARVTLERVELARARAELAAYVAGPAAVAASAGDQRGTFRSDSLRVVVNDTEAVVQPAGLSPLAGYIERGRLARPDLIASRARVAVANAEIGYQQALTVRQVGATIGTRRVAGVTSLLAGLSLPLPLFDQNRGQVQRATGERMAAEQELVWAERQVFAEVEAAYEAARLLTEQANRLRGSFLGRAEESRRIALAAYQDGAVSLLQVLDASRTLSDARLTYYRTLFAQRQSLLELQAAIGASPLDASPMSAAPISDLPPADATPPGRARTRPSSLSPSVPDPTPTPRRVRPSGDRP